MSASQKRNRISLVLAVALCALFAAPSLSSSVGDAKKGQEIFESLTCVDCHKGGGNSVHPSKPLKGEAFLQRYPKDEKIAKLIRKGVPTASMPSFGKDVISDEQMKDVIAYIRSLTPVKPADASKTVGKSTTSSKTGKN